MPGRKQHFIPQHFQQPFAIDDSQHKIWLYRKGMHKPNPASIRDTAAQRDFYSEPSDDELPTLDDLITEYEISMQYTVDHLRLLNIGDVIDPVTIAEVVTHLAMRSSYMRGVIDDAATSMAKNIQEVAEGELDGRTLKFPAHKVPSSVEKQILDEFEERGLLALTPVDRKTLAKLAYFALREGSDQFLSEARELIGKLAGELADKSHKFGPHVQTSVLSKSMAPVARIEKLVVLDWKVVRSPNGHSILPDCTSIAFDGKEWASLIFVENEELQAVVLPLTPERLAVGVRKGYAAPDLADFDQIAARASHMFFLSSKRREKLDNLLFQLGDQVRDQVSSLTKGAMTKAVDKMLNADPHLLYEPHAEHAASQSWFNTQNIGQINFSVQLFDFGDNALAIEISEAVNAIVIAFSRYLPVHDVSGFVFANDYHAALKSVVNDLQPLESENLIGVSMPVTIRMDGKVKTMVVSRSNIAVDLISDDEGNKSEAVNTILHSLSSTALTSLMQNKFPDLALSSAGDEYEGTIFQYTRGVFNSYFCAAISCSISSYVQFYEDLALDALKRLIVDLPKERREYRAHDKMEVMFPVVAGLISDLLTATARFLGALKNKSMALDEATQLWMLLEENQLVSWVELFQKDLQSFDDGLETWAHFDEAFFVNRHFERIAVQFSIVPVPTDCGGAYVHVL